MIDNSLNHGFCGIKGGLIIISLIEKQNSFILKYKDDGLGTEDHVSRKIFEPFFTTKRGQGYSGLGLNIIYNLVVHKLKGQIKCNCNLGYGLEIEIILDKKMNIKEARKFLDKVAGDIMQGYRDRLEEEEPDDIGFELAEHDELADTADLKKVQAEFKNFRSYVLIITDLGEP